jgi:PAS domain-containing protein
LTITCNSSYYRSTPMDDQTDIEELKRSERHFRLLFENMLNGFAFCRMIYDESKNPTDFIYLEVNHAFGTLTGLKDVVGKKVTQVIPGIRESNPELFNIYSRVATSGKPEQFETYLPPLSMWLSISVYSPESEHFAAVFENITARKNSENSLLQKNAELEKFNKMVVDRELLMVDMKKKIKELEDKLAEKEVTHA